MVSSFPMKKNTATKIVFPILDADGDLVTGAAGLDSEYSVDGGTFADCTNEATEIATSSGMYYLNLVAGETNGDVIAIIVKTSTSGAKTTALVFYTAAQTLDETDVIADAIKAKTDSLAFTSGNVHSHLKALDNIDLSATMKASVNTEVDNALNTAIPLTPTADSVNERVKAIDDKLPTDYIMGSSGQTAKDDEIDAIKAKTDSLAFTAGNVHSHIKVTDDIDLSATQKASVNAEVDTALNTAIPAVNTADSINDILLDTLGTDVWATATRALTDKAGFSISGTKTTLDALNDITAASVWAVATRALTDKVGFSLAADQSAVTIGTVNTLTTWDKTGYALSATAIDAILDDVVEGTLTLRQGIMLMTAMMAGKSSGGGTATLIYRDYGDTKARLTFTVDPNGNRTAVTRDVT